MPIPFASASASFLSCCKPGPLLLGLQSGNTPSFFSSQTEIHSPMPWSADSFYSNIFILSENGQRWTNLDSPEFLTTFYDALNITVKDRGISSIPATRKIRASKVYFQQLYYCWAGTLLCRPQSLALIVSALFSILFSCPSTLILLFVWIGRAVSNPFKDVARIN